MTDPILLQCPFCGNDTGRLHSETIGNVVEVALPWVSCLDCNAKVDGNSRRQVVDAWNTRDGELIIEGQFVKEAS